LLGLCRELKDARPPGNRPDLKDRIAMPEKPAFSIVEHRLCRATIAARTIERP